MAGTRSTGMTDNSAAREIPMDEMTTAEIERLESVFIRVSKIFSPEGFTMSMRSVAFGDGPSGPLRVLSRSSFGVLEFTLPNFYAMAAKLGIE